MAKAHGRASPAPPAAPNCPCPYCSSHSAPATPQRTHGCALPPSVVPWSWGAHSLQLVHQGGSWDLNPSKTGDCHPGLGQAALRSQDHFGSALQGRWRNNVVLMLPSELGLQCLNVSCPSFLRQVVGPSHPSAPIHLLGTCLLVHRDFLSSPV